MCKKTKKALQDLSDSILLYASALTDMVGDRHDVPRDVSSWLGKTISTLEMQNDQVRFFTLGVDFRKDNKQKAVAKIIKKRSPK